MPASRAGFWLPIKNHSFRLNPADKEKHQFFLLLDHDNKEKTTWQPRPHFPFHIHK